jgi:hypothetical protein
MIEEKSSSPLFRPFHSLFLSHIPIFNDDEYKTVKNLLILHFRVKNEKKNKGSYYLLSCWVWSCCVIRYLFLYRSFDFQCHHYHQHATPKPKATLLYFEVSKPIVVSATKRTAEEHIALRSV